MKINHNLSAVVANNKLHQNEDILAGSMERLASGIRINHAKDDPAGMAISSRMTTQIDGIDRASQNSSDASAMIETADGALNEVHSILQRMRELSVQAANDTNALSDREAIQKEIAELKKEIDRMSRDTEYNTKGLLDGTLDNRCYTSKKLQDPTTNLYLPDMTRISVSDYVAAGEYKMKITPATQTTLTGSGPFKIDPTDGATRIGTDAGTIDVNGFLIELNEDDTYASAYLKICDGMEKAEVEFNASYNATPTLKSQFYGSQQQIRVVTSNPALAELIGKIESDSTDPNHGVPNQGSDATIIPDAASAFENKSTSYTADGNHITIHQPSGFEIDFLANADLPAGSDISLEVTTMGAMQIQIGANENQTAHMRIPRLDLETLYLDDLDVTTVYGADRAIGKLDWALDKVSSVRAKIGAYENRLDHAVASLDQSSENLTKAFSALADVDMAEEMTKYTQYNVLVQASTSVLAQANDLPESVLQLLQ